MCSSHRNISHDIQPIGGVRVRGATTITRSNLCIDTQLFVVVALESSRLMPALAHRIAATRKWLQTVVLAERLCPFAPPVSLPPKLRLRASEATDEASLVVELSEEADILARGCEAAPAHETTLLVLPQGGWCARWPQLVSASWALQAEAIAARGHAGVLQIVLFHPEAVRSTYAEVEETDAADYALRSPYPIVQLLRESDILAAVRSYPDTEGIPARNAARLRALGEGVCRERLAACLEPSGGEGR